MKLKSTVIKNYRGIKEETLVSFQDFNCIVGKNDVGKSTLLKAIDAFLNENNPNIEDKNVYSDSNFIEINLIFDSASSPIILDDTIPVSLFDEELVDENGKRVTAGISFVPENEEGTIEMTFELDARRLAGKSVVVFERLYDEEEHLIAKEEDIENADQSILYRNQVIPKNTIVEKPGHNSKEVRKSPKTGDENRMDLWLVMLCVCGIAVVTEIVIYKRRNR